MNFAFEPTELPEVLLVEHQRYGDERGSFAEVFRADVFEQAGIPRFVQANVSRSSRGVLRGLHCQNDPAALAKLVCCTRGRIFDVTVDVRRGSSRFGRWVGVELGEDDTRMLYVPPGFAHGFCTLSEIADISYQQTDYYAPDLERSIIWNDPEIGIAWPIQDPTLSPRDAEAPLLRDADINLVYRAPS